MAAVKTQSIEYSSRFTCARTVHIHSDFREMPRHDRYALNRRFYSILKISLVRPDVTRTDKYSRDCGTCRIDLSDDKNAVGADFSMMHRAPWWPRICKYTSSYARGNKIFQNNHFALHSHREYMSCFNIFVKNTTSCCFISKISLWQAEHYIVISSPM